MLCPLCHTQNRENAKFCKGCGQPLAVEVVASAQPETTEQSDLVHHDQAQEMPSSSLAPEEHIHPENSAAQQSTSSVPAPDAPEREVPENATSFRVPQGQETATEADAENDDIASGPTQILTPQQMLAFHARRWQQDVEREGQQRHYDDIADAPTLLITPDAHPANQQEATSEDASRNPVYSTDADEAMVAVPTTGETLETEETSASNEEGQGHSSESVSAVQPLQPSASASTTSQSADNDQQVEAVAAHEDTSTEQEQNSLQHDTEGSAPQTEVSVPSTEEELLEPTTGNTETTETGEANDLKEQNTTAAESKNDLPDESASSDFPVLEVGTTIGDRYEVTQVLDDVEHEHMYEVADRKGYLHCWNCGSEENAEGDEFCIDCGAELLNASYILHEYSSSGAHEGEAQVLQGAIINTFVDRGNTYVVEQLQAAQSAFPNGVHLIAASESDAGMVRRAETNEDSTLVLQLERIHESIATPTGLFVVADGMGGHANGQGASRATIGLMAERVVRELILPPLNAEKTGEAVPTYDDENLKELIRSAIEEANTALCQINQRDKSDMGSTLTGFMMMGDRAYIFNVGDSRTYMLRGEKLYQMTNDHSLVGQLVAGGLIEPEDVYTHPQRNQIFRSIGDKQNVQVDLFTQQVQPGDILLSCSDGLWEMVRDPQIAEILNQAPDPQAACAKLIETANANGGEDNVSAVVVFVR